MNLVVNIMISFLHVQAWISSYCTIYMTRGAWYQRPVMIIAASSRAAQRQNSTHRRCIASMNSSHFLLPSNCDVSIAQIHCDCNVLHFCGDSRLRIDDHLFLHADYVVLPDSYASLLRSQRHLKNLLI